MSKQALLLVGSPKLNSSTSEVLGDYVLEGLQKHGLRTEKLNIHKLFKSNQGSEVLIRAANECDILIFSCPLYVDSTPATVIRAMEVIAESRREKKPLKKQLMLAISNCGFPEAHQNQTALSIYKCFAEEAGFAWAGGLALGGGGTINGQPLEKLGGMAKNIKKSLDLTVLGVISGSTVPEEAIKLLGKPMIPNWLYFLAGQFGWRIQAKKYGAQKKLNERPYLN